MTAIAAADYPNQRARRDTDFAATLEAIAADGDAKSFLEWADDDANEERLIIIAKAYVLVDDQFDEFDREIVDQDSPDLTVERHEQ